MDGEGLWQIDNSDYFIYLTNNILDQKCSIKITSVKNNQYLGLFFFEEGSPTKT